VVEESSDIVDEERVEQFGDLFFVGEFEGTLERNPTEVNCELQSIANYELRIKDLPDTFQMHWANLDHMLLLLTLENAITSASGHTSNVKELGSINHMVVFSNQQSKQIPFALRDKSRPTFSSSNTSTLDINLEAQGSLILPESGCNSRLHTGRGNLSRCISGNLLLTISSLHVHRSHWRQWEALCLWWWIGAVRVLRITELDIVRVLRVLACRLDFLALLRRWKVRLGPALWGLCVGRTVR